MKRLALTLAVVTTALGVAPAVASGARAQVVKPALVKQQVVKQQVVKQALVRQVWFARSVQQLRVLGH